MKKIIGKITGTVIIILSGFSAIGQQVVLQGDFPDPSVVKIGNYYWASATTSNWLPAYPLLKSKDLINWKTEGFVFTKPPEWADYYFWAPEISYENGKVYVYYAAHKKGGNLCLGIASADKPEGPYKDHGPLMCEEAGSIDAFPMRDENGKLYLIWKEDANSVRKPTPIWAMEMNEERTKLIGEKKELFRNKIAWEENLVEGVSMIKHGGYFYAFYAAAGCCGVGCTYVVGVARAKNLLGPWEKDVKNPILKNSDQWICPGHGTPVEKDGKYYFLHHAYDKKTNAFTGRQGLLSEFKFTNDGWVEFVANPAPIPKPGPVKDKFKGGSLATGWEWSVFQNVDFKLRKGNLELGALPVSAGAFVGHKITTGDYSATTTIRKKDTDAASGIGAIGDERNTLSVFFSGDTIKLVRLKDDSALTVASRKVDVKKKLDLKMEAKGGRYFTFSYSADGEDFVTLNDKPIDAIFLPPWDRAVRAGLVAKGNAGQKAVFESFELVSN
ncbi:MAG: xylB [Segetibacter sp.]|jgi:xylan 1,4-beta-xylosidase|nr:xylB [Segetibacter sp.]